MDATVNVLQWLAAQEVKALVEGSGLSEEARAALHAIVGCAGAAAQSGSCSSAALGAAGNVVLNNLIYGTDVDASKLSAQERENRINLLNSIITGVTLAVGGDSAMASAAAKIEAENNALSISNVDRVYTAIQQCLGNQSCRTEDLRKEFEDKEAEYLKTVINNCYGAGATVSTCRSSASALGTSIQHLDALRAQLGYNNSTPAEAQALAYVMYLWEDSTALLEDINQNMPTVDIPTQLNQIRDQLQEGETGFWETASSVTGIYLTTTGFGTGGGNRSSRNRPTTGAPASIENKPGGSSSTAVGGSNSSFANIKPVAVNPTRLTTPESNPGTAQSRVNVAHQTPDPSNPEKTRGFDYAMRNHSVNATIPNKSRFTIPDNEVKALLQQPGVVQSPVYNIRNSATNIETGKFVRQVDVGTPIGISDGKSTSVITVITDRKGNLVNTYPGLLDK